MFGFRGQRGDLVKLALLGWRRVNRLTLRYITVYDTTYNVIRMPDPTLLVLSSLADGEKHGYAMTEDIRRFADVRLGAGTLYGAITRLEQRGWIESVQSQDRRRPYRLTTAGRVYLEEQLGSLSKVLRVATRRLERA